MLHFADVSSQSRWNERVCMPSSWLKHICHHLIVTDHFPGMSLVVIEASSVPSRHLPWYEAAQHK